jgi:hypothetical protein
MYERFLPLLGALLAVIFARGMVVVAAAYLLLALFRRLSSEARHLCGVRDRHLLH